MWRLRTWGKSFDGVFAMHLWSSEHGYGSISCEVLGREGRLYICVFGRKCRVHDMGPCVLNLYVCVMWGVRVWVLTSALLILIMLWSKHDENGKRTKLKWHTLFLHIGRQVSKSTLASLHFAKWVASNSECQIIYCTHFCVTKLRLKKRKWLYTWLG